MARTMDCGEGRHGDCSGTGHRAYMFPQEDRRYDEPPFACGCTCHHGGQGVPCVQCAHPNEERPT